jgi:hypothetical protein
MPLLGDDRRWSLAAVIGVAAFGRRDLQEA